MDLGSGKTFTVWVPGKFDDTQQNTIRTKVNAANVTQCLMVAVWIERNLREGRSKAIDRVFDAAKRAQTTLQKSDVQIID